MDQETSVPISDVIVSTSTNQQSLTDHDGYASLTGLKDDDLIYFNCIGFHAKALRWLEMKTNPIVTLHPDPIEIDPVLVVGQLPKKIANASYHLSPGSMQNLFALGGVAGRDVLKAIQFLPGVRADDDLSAEIKIRGSDASETLVILDGIPIHKSEHYYGIFGSINSDYIVDFDLYRNLVPIEYGGKTSGLLSLASEKDIAKFEGTLESNLIFSTLSLKAPVNDKWSFTLGGRATYFNAAQSQTFDFISNRQEAYRAETQGISRQRLIQSTPLFNFFDANARLLFQPSSQTQLDVNFFMSQDHFENDYDLVFLTSLLNIEREAREISTNLEDWSNLGMSMNLRHRVSDNVRLFGTIYSSSFDNRTSIRSQLRQPQDKRHSFSNEQFNQISEQGGFLYLENFNAKIPWKIGFSSKNLTTEFTLSEDESQILTLENEFWSTSGFAEMSVKLGKFNWTLGGRLTNYTGTQSFLLDPQSILTYSLGNKWILKGSLSYAHQFVRELNYENRLTQSFDYFVLADNMNFPVGTSFNLMMGTRYQKGLLTFDLEFYQRKLDGVLEYALRTPGFGEAVGPSERRDYAIFTGTGLVIGMDALLSLKLGNYQANLAYTLSENTRRLRAVRKNMTFPSEDDRRHQVKWSNSLSLGRFTLSANVVYSSGRPYLDLAQLEVAQDRRQFSERSFLSRLPSYQRLDVGLMRDFTIFEKKLQLEISCFNILDRANVKYIQYIYAVPSSGSGHQGVERNVVGTEAGLLPRTINASLRLEF